jgi:hypothetical protein
MGYSNEYYIAHSLTLLIRFAEVQMAEGKSGCVQPSKGILTPIQNEEKTDSVKPQEVIKMTVQVGKPAPDFEASAFVEGGFKNIKLSDYKGKWIILCFYPGDFTFV